MIFPEIYSATGMMELIQKIGFLPLLDSDIEGFSAEDIVSEDCGYVRLPEGGWDWPLWKWKVAIKREQSQACLSFAEREQARRSQRRDCSGNAVYIRKVLQQESRIHQRGMVAGFLQLQKEQVSSPR